MNFKYVRHNTVGFILWPDTPDLIHSRIGATVISGAGGSIVSAGFAQMRFGAVTCSGRSESLNIASNKDDTLLLAEQLGLEMG